jgi:hypothetical protein
MVTDPPTRRKNARWPASVVLALSAGLVACNSLLELPEDPYLVEPGATAPEPTGVASIGAPAQSVLPAPERPTSPELEIDEMQGGSETVGAGNQPGGGGVATGGASDAGVSPDAAPAVGTACPAGAALGPSGRCYVAVQNTLTAPAAQRSCLALGPGWDLAAIHDAATNTFLGTLIDVEAWIGASDDDVEGEWTWVIDDVPFWSGDGDTGVPVNGEFESWADGEPNGNSDCARLVPNPPRWANLDCGSRRASLCEGPPL